MKYISKDDEEAFHHLLTQQYFICPTGMDKIAQTLK